MPGPTPTPCPKCRLNPRRCSGGLCNPCQTEHQRRQRETARRKKAKADKTPRFTRALQGKRYVITSAQNATPVDPKFFTALEVAAKHLGAELVVIPFRYRNPTSIWTQHQERNEWWGIPPHREAAGETNSLRPYLFNTRKKLCETLVLAADVKIQPTAVRPLSGFEALTGAESTILGHPKMQLVSVPAPAGRRAKVLSTTGACTVKNYTDTKQGKLGAFHHFLGAVVVEVDGPDFFLFQINADRKTGSFIHHEKHYSRRGVRPAPPALGFIQGDKHVRFHDPAVDRAMFGPGGIVDVLNPKQVVWHDTLDGYAVNHHHKDDPFIAAAKAKAGFGDIRAEVEQAVDHVRERTKGRRSVIVASNHDDFLARWLRSTDWRYAGVNAEFLLETALAVRRSARMTDGGAEYLDAFAYWVKRLRRGADIRCLSLRQAYKIGGIDVSNHGHKGPDGAKAATMKNMARIGARTFTAHAHSAGIEEGHYRVPTTSRLNLEYVSGPSSWRHGGGVIYGNGKRSLLFINGDKWRLEAAR